MIRRMLTAISVVVASFTLLTAVPVNADDAPFGPVDSCNDLEPESNAWWNCHDFVLFGWWWLPNDAVVKPRVFMAAPTEPVIDPSAVAPRR